MESVEVGPINIGNHDEYTISALAKMTCKLANKKLNSNHTDFTYKDLPSNDPRKRKSDIIYTKAKTLLKWELKFNIIIYSVDKFIGVNYGCTKYSY